MLIDDFPIELINLLSGVGSETLEEALLDWALGTLGTI